MKSKVYIIEVNNSDGLQTIKLKFARLLNKSKIADSIQKENKIVIKIHFGEEGNTGYVRPEYVRVLCEAVTKKGAIPIAADTNTLYMGRRTNSEDHRKLAYEHGFTQEILGAPIVIPDDSKMENTSTIPINQQFIKEAKVVKLFLQADVIVGIAHFKGHIMTSFGGALKNIGMGCATREGKLMQHSDLSPFIISEKCTGCSKCHKICPAEAIYVNNKKVYIDNSKCVGCASCISVCNDSAIDVYWESGADTIQEKMIEYTKAVLDSKKESSLFVNFLIKITKDCDCLAEDDPRIAPDIGILASKDPVSIDKASLDLVTKVCGKNIFKEVHPSRDGSKQLQYAHKLGLGELDYDLTEVHN